MKNIILVLFLFSINLLPMPFCEVYTIARVGLEICSCAFSRKTRKNEHSDNQDVEEYFLGPLNKFSINCVEAESS
jgi:hypothetical protein